MSDSPLNENGLREAASAAKVVARFEVSSIHSSPVRRALQTAQIISDACGVPVVQDNDFIDVNYGGWQGLKVSEVADQFGSEAIEAWKRDPVGFEFPGGDRLSDVLTRLKDALSRLFNEYEGLNVCVVSHLAVLKLAFLAAFELPSEWFWRLELENGSVSSILYSQERGIILETWNFVSDMKVL
jgi:broad specificity phosphatase PhoE